MSRKADLEELGQLSVMWHELFRMTKQGTRDVRAVKNHLTQAIEGKFLVTTREVTEEAVAKATLDLQGAPPWRRFGFAPAGVQFLRLHYWNDRLKLGISPQQLEPPAFSKGIMAYPWDQPLVPLTLCWTLDTLEATMNAHIKVIKHAYGEKNVEVSNFLNTDPAHLSQMDGAPAFRPNSVTWKVIDLGANHGRAPDQIPPIMAAGVEVYDVVAQHPDYVRRQNGDDIPYLHVPGLRTTTTDAILGESDPRAPFVRWWDQEPRMVCLSAAWPDDASSRFAGPVIVREY